MWRRYALTVGLPHTNHRNLAEARLLMEAGHAFWSALGEAIGTPVSRLRSAAGSSVYATIFFVEERYPAGRTLDTFLLDERLWLVVGIRSVSRLSTEAAIAFDTQERLGQDADPDESWWAMDAPPHPLLRFGSLFAGPDPSTGQLKVAAPSSAELAGLSPLAAGGGVSPIARHGKDTGRLGVIPDEWPSAGPAGAVETAYVIDPDRDTNATGLVYFANFVALAELGERLAVGALAGPDANRQAQAAKSRRVLWRRVAYYEQAAPSERVTIAASGFAPAQRSPTLGLRVQISRERDGALLSLSESRLALSWP